MRNYRLAVLCLSLLLATSCSDTPSGPAKEVTELGGMNVYILCEGLYGNNNSTLARYDAREKLFTRDFFAARNPGLRLGDNANDMVARGDTAYVAVDHSGTIEVFRLSDGASLGRILLGNDNPRYIALADSFGYFTSWYDNSVVEFNARSFTLTGRRLQVGPAPEGIAAYGDYLFVANSGAGVFQDTVPGSRTVSVIHRGSLSETGRIPSGINTVSVLPVPERNALYVLYKNLSNDWSGDGGIIEYNLNSHSRLREWKLPASSYSLIISPDKAFLYTLTPDGVAGVDLGAENRIFNAVANPKKSDIWYSVAVNPSDGSFWIGNARNNSISGTLIVANSQGSITSETVCGINPNTILFF